MNILKYIILTFSVIFLYLAAIVKSLETDQIKAAMNTFAASDFVCETSSGSPISSDIARTAHWLELGPSKHNGELCYASGNGCRTCWYEEALRFSACPRKAGHRDGFGYNDVGRIFLALVGHCGRQYNGVNRAGGKYMPPHPEQGFYFQVSY